MIKTICWTSVVTPPFINAQCIVCNHSVHDFLVSIEDVNGGSSRCLNDVADVKTDDGAVNENAKEVADIVCSHGGAMMVELDVPLQTRLPNELLLALFGDCLTHDVV